MALKKKANGNGFDLKALFRFPNRFFPLGKKGVFFTFVASIFLALLVFSSSIGYNYDMRQKSFAIETRISTMNGFINSLEKDIERGAYIAGFRSLIAIEDYVISGGEYISDLNSTFNELFFNGTIEGNTSYFLINNSFNLWMSKIENEAAKVDIILDFFVNNANITQEDPWNVKLDLDVSMVIKDTMGTIDWNKRKVISTYLEIDDFEDPMYMLGTNGVFSNKIRRTIFENFTDGANIDNLLNHTYEGYYVEFSGAPSYLMRLQGDFGSSEYGIESLVDIVELVGKGVSVLQRSIVDYVYFGRGANPKKYQVSGAPNWFDLDNLTNIEGNSGHLDVYQVGSLT